MIYPKEKDDASSSEATAKVREFQRQNEAGTITNDERRNKVVDTWSGATEHDRAVGVQHPLAIREGGWRPKKGDPRNAHRMIINPVYVHDGFRRPW